MSNSLYFLKRYLNLFFFVIALGFVIQGSYGIFKLMGYLDSMGNGLGESIYINKYLFSAPIFLLFIPIVVRIWRKSRQDTVNFQKNGIAASIAIYISIFIIGGMVSRTLFAKRAEVYGYRYCLSKEDVSGVGATGQTIPVRPEYTVWMPEDGCEKR